jgi:hypothetical protein
MVQRAWQSRAAHLTVTREADRDREREREREREIEPSLAHSLLSFHLFHLEPQLLGGIAHIQVGSSPIS